MRLAFRQEMVAQSVCMRGGWATLDEGKASSGRAHGIIATVGPIHASFNILPTVLQHEKEVTVHESERGTDPIFIGNGYLGCENLAWYHASSGMKMRQPPTRER